MSVGNNMPFYGYDSAMGLAEQATLTTFVTSTTWLEFNSEGLKHNIERKALDEISASRFYKKNVTLTESAQGTIEFNVNPAANGFCLLLKHTLGGTVSSVAIAGGAAYEHTFNIGDFHSNAGTTGSDTHGLSVAVRRGAQRATGNNVWNYFGGRVNQMTLKADVGNPVVCTADMVFVGCSIGATVGAVTYSDIQPIVFSGVTIKTADNLASVTAEYFKSFELSINNNLMTDFRVLGDRKVQDFPTGRLDVKLKLNQYFDTTSSYDRYIANTLTYFQINLDSGITIGAVSTTYGCVINIPSNIFNATHPVVGNDKVLTYDIDLNAFYNPSLGSIMQVLVRNATANYK